MSRFLVAVLGALLVVSVGCQDRHKHDDDMHRGDAMKASGDVCPHCPGVQKATADGKCPMCGMAVKTSSSSSAGGGSAKAASASGDACAHCPGKQTATAEGKCPECGMSVATK